MGYKSLCFILGNNVSDFRLEYAARYLLIKNYDLEVLSTVPLYKAVQHDIFIISRPGMDMCHFIGDLLVADRTVIIDMDDDFYSIPFHNSSYKLIGKGRPDYLKILEQIISAASVLTVPNQVLSSRYHRFAELVPNGWDSDNELWRLPRVKSNYVNIGWAGTSTHGEDFKLAAPAILRVLDKRKNARIVIGGDEAIYKMFESVPEEQKLFLNGVKMSVYPAMFTFFDILVAPLVNDTFNLAKSDLKCVDASARSIPCLASPLPMYTEWNEGVLFANSDEEWEVQLLKLIDSPDLRTKLGQEGHVKAETRTIDKIGEVWEGLIKQWM
jgi:glycosyltransferase involved in cell wall biosynthesis